MYMYTYKRGTERGFGTSHCKTWLKEVKRRTACIMRLIIRWSKLVLLCLKLESAKQIQRAVAGPLPAVKQAPVGVTFSPQTQKHVEGMTLSRSTRHHTVSALPHAIWAVEVLVRGWCISCSQHLWGRHQGPFFSSSNCPCAVHHPSFLSPQSLLPQPVQQGFGLWSMEHVRHGLRHSCYIGVNCGCSPCNTEMW